MIKLELKKLLEYLHQKDLNAQIQKETNQIYILFKIGEQEYPLFLRIFEGGELLQLLAFIPCNIKHDAVNDTARLLHLLNKELDVPGFGMDETAMVVFYRCMIPAKNEEVDSKLLDAYMNSIQIVCKTFSPVITAVAFGTATYSEVVKKAKDNEKSATKKKTKGKP